MSSDILHLTPSETYAFVTDALRCGHVPYIAGPPAIGKSQVGHQVARDANLKLLDIRLSQMLSEDMTGIPEKDPKTGKAKYLPFDTFPLEGDDIPDGYAGWLVFLDELSSASEEVLAAAYSIILDHMVGGKKLHPNCVIMAAGNRASDSAIARPLPDTLITRMLPVEMKVSNKDWLWWAASEDVDSNEAVVDFLKKNPNMLYAPTKPSDRDELETYATPRGWEKVFAHVNLHERRTKKEVEAVDAAGVPTGEMTNNPQAIGDGIFHLMSAAVGSMAARSFKEEYNENIQLPYPWEIAQSPASTRIPTSNVAKTTVTNSLTKYFIESDSQSRDNVLIYMNRLGGEFRELFINEIKDQLGETPTDKRLIQETSERLQIDPLLGGTGGADPSNPF